MCHQCCRNMKEIGEKSCFFFFFNLCLCEAYILVYSDRISALGKLWTEHKLLICWATLEPWPNPLESISSFWNGAGHTNLLVLLWKWKPWQHLERFRLTEATEYTLGPSLFCLFVPRTHYLGDKTKGWEGNYSVVDYLESLSAHHWAKSEIKSKSGILIR